MENDLELIENTISKCQKEICMFVLHSETVLNSHRTKLPIYTIILRF